MTDDLRHRHPPTTGTSTYEPCHTSNLTSTFKLAKVHCAKAIHHAQSDGIHNKHWWEHIGAALSEWGGKIAEIANDIAPVLDVLALATSWIPGVDVVTAGLAEADNLIALAGTGLEITGDAMQGHWGDALLGAGMLGATFLGGKALEKFGGAALEKLEGSLGKDTEHGAQGVEGNGFVTRAGDPVDVVSGQMITEEVDLALPGVLALVLRRAYASNYAPGRLFGPGWSSTLDQRVAVNEAGIHYAGDDAQILHYPMPTGSDPLLPLGGTPWPLTWDRASDEIRITDRRSGHVRHFSVVHYDDERGQIRDLTAVTDPNGNRIDILRDDDGTPTAIEHSGGYRVEVRTATTPSGIRITGLALVFHQGHDVAA